MSPEYTVQGFVAVQLSGEHEAVADMSSQLFHVN